VSLNGSHLIITKFISDMHCDGYSTTAITDENEIFTWGKVKTTKGSQEGDEVFNEPNLIFKTEELILNNLVDENTILDRIFNIKNLGFMFTTKISNSYFHHNSNYIELV